MRTILRPESGYSSHRSCTLTTRPGRGSIRTSRGQFRAIQHFARLRFAPRVAWEEHNRCERAYRDGALPAPRLAVVLGPRTQADTETGHPLTGRRHCWAHARRDDEVICGRVELNVTADTRLGLAPRERRRVALRFAEYLHPALHEIKFGFRESAP